MQSEIGDGGRVAMPPTTRGSVRCTAATTAASARLLDPLHVIYVLVVLYALCYQLQAPLEPFLVEKLVEGDEDSSAAFARLQSFFSMAQLVGSLVVGYLLDVAGLCHAQSTPRAFP